MLFGELKTRVASGMGLSLQNSTEDTLIRAWLNEGRDQMLARGKLRVERATAALTAGATNYEMNTNVVGIIRLLFNNRPLDPWSVDEIDRANQNSSGIIRGWCLLGTNYLKFAGVAAEDDAIDFEYVPSASTMTADGHDPADPVYGGISPLLHGGIEAYAKWKAGDWDNNESSQNGLVYKAEFEEWVRQAKTYRNRIRGRPAPARLRRSTWAMTPGTDTGQGWGG